MQKRNGLRAQFCRSAAAEEASEEFWIMIELTDLLQISGRNPKEPPKIRKSRGGACVGVRQLAARTSYHFSESSLDIIN